MELRHSDLTRTHLVLRTLSLTKLTYPVSPGHFPFLSLLYSSHSLAARKVLAAKRGAGAKAAVKATRATKRRMTLANIVEVYFVENNVHIHCRNRWTTSTQHIIFLTSFLIVAVEFWISAHETFRCMFFVRFMCGLRGSMTYLKYTVNFEKSTRIHCRNKTVTYGSRSESFHQNRSFRSEN
jgi:hypothetical protein